MTEKELDLLRFSSARWQSRAHVRRRSCGARFWIPVWPAAALTICQIALGVIPSPHTSPSRFTRRKIGPSLAPEALVQSSTARFAHAARERSEYVFLCRSSPPEPSGLLGAGNRPSSTQQAPHGGVRTRSTTRESHGRACRVQSPSPALAADLSPGQR